MPVNRLQPRVDHTTLTTGAVMTLTRNDPQGGAATFLPRVHTETFDHCQVAQPEADGRNANGQAVAIDGGADANCLVGTGFHLAGPSAGAGGASGVNFAI